MSRDRVSRDRVSRGPKNPLTDVTATFAATDPHAVIARIRDVLLAVLPYAAGPAANCPAEERWTDLLPAWCVAPGAVAGRRPWIGVFAPDVPADARGRRWWDAGVANTGWVRFGVDGPHNGGRDALLRLLEAAGRACRPTPLSRAFDRGAPCPPRRADWAGRGRAPVSHGKQRA